MSALVADSDRVSEREKEKECVHEREHNVYWVIYTTNAWISRANEPNTWVWCALHFYSIVSNDLRQPWIRKFIYISSVTFNPLHSFAAAVAYFFTAIALNTQRIILFCFFSVVLCHLLSWAMDKLISKR